MNIFLQNDHTTLFDYTKLQEKYSTIAILYSVRFDLCHVSCYQFLCIFLD